MNVILEPVPAKPWKIWVMQLPWSIQNHSSKWPQIPSGEARRFSTHYHGVVTESFLKWTWRSLSVNWFRSREEVRVIIFHLSSDQASVCSFQVWAVMWSGREEQKESCKHLPSSQGEAAVSLPSASLLLGRSLSPLWDRHEMPGCNVSSWGPRGDQHLRSPDWPRRLTLAWLTSPSPLNPPQMYSTVASSGQNDFAGQSVLVWNHQQDNSRWIPCCYDRPTAGKLYPAKREEYKLTAPLHPTRGPGSTVSQVSFPFLRSAKQTSNQDMTLQSSRIPLYPGIS